MSKNLFFGLLLLLYLIVTLSVSPHFSYATISACSVSVSPTSVNTGSSAALTFNLANDDDTGNQIRYVKITSPSSNLTITNAAGPHTGEIIVGDSGSNVVMKLSGAIPSGDTADYTVDVTAGSTEASSASFSVQVTDASEGEDLVSCSGDTGVSIAESSSSSSSSTTTTITTTTSKAKTDSQPPKVSLSTNLVKPFKEVPFISGVASDDTGVVLVDYSLDGGGNWIPVTILTGTSVSFGFKPAVLDDGNYDIIARATDKVGNTTLSSQYTLIIDRLPPQVGMTVLSVGPQVFVPSTGGVLTTVAGLAQKITVSAIGGPTSLEVLAGEEKFNLEKNSESGLWSGVVKFASEGTYDLTTKSVDGAKNETIQKLAKVRVLAPGKVSYVGNAVNGAEVSVYIFEPTLGAFIFWDGVAYGQKNPQKTNETGDYSLYLPSGKYYMEARISAFVKLRSQIFTLSGASAINADFSAGILSTPFVFNEINVASTKGLSEVEAKSELIGKDFPFDTIDTGLTSLTTEGFKGENLKGKDIVSFVSTILPDTSSQIAILENLTDSINLVVVVPQESSSTVEIYKKRGHYNVDMLDDPDGKLVEPLSLRFLPVHFFVGVDEKIKSVKYGVLSKGELEIRE